MITIYLPKTAAWQLFLVLDNKNLVNLRPGIHMPGPTVEFSPLPGPPGEKMAQHQGATMWPVRLHRVVAVKTSAYEEFATNVAERNVEIFGSKKGVV